MVTTGSSSDEDGTRFFVVSVSYWFGLGYRLTGVLRGVI